MSSQDDTTCKILNENHEKKSQREYLRYGWKYVSFNCLQKFNKPIFYVIFLCMAGFSSSLVVNGFTLTIATSLERQFGFTSSEVAIFQTMYDIAYGFCCVLVGHFGSSHKPRCIAWGLLIIAVGSALLTTPKFLMGPYNVGIVQQRTDFCQSNATSNMPIDCRQEKQWYYKFIFIIGYLLFGIGATPLYTVGIAHIYDIFSQRQGGLYMGIYYAFVLLGASLGFVLNGPILRNWVDLNLPASSSLTPKSPNWVGAWWLGYLIGIVIVSLPFFPMLGFPEEFPNTQAKRAIKRQLAETKGEDKELKNDLKSIVPATKALANNLTFVFITLTITCEALNAGGFSPFYIKFVHTQFQVPIGKAASVGGIIILLGGTLGIVSGGYLVKRFSLTCKQILRLSVVIGFLSILFTGFTLIGCAGREVVGLNKDTGNHLFNTQCNKGCECSTDYYKPVCTLQDQKTFYSPCHAGCAKDNLMADNMFHNCTCFSPNVTVASYGRCYEKCNLFPVYMASVIISFFIGSLNAIPLTNSLFRIVNDGQGSFAIGAQQTITRFLGTVPGPIIYGALIDKSCDLWQEDSCSGEITNCLEYDQLNFRLYIFSIRLAMKILSFVFMVLAYRFYEVPKEDKASNVDVTQNEIAESVGNIKEEEELL